jgi:hypothetical protein
MARCAVLSSSDLMEQGSDDLGRGTLLEAHEWIYPQATARPCKDAEKPHVWRLLAAHHSG